ncbi:rCG61915 [Rattus norvegicus]|uniref:RCG61915 n=2 Tax=Rattus norvegicus TaxID=10116 RepID=A6HAQ0_RAT|nr:RAD51-associated protein 2 [Rattus norvegicus]EDM03105.1 rCG61915 [Rattus norvegicus]|eukprot:XP_006239961.1 PREDICTED: RAD51-associated protein 2 [Rattus norvegicus]
MSLSRPAWPSGPAWPLSSEPPPQDPAAASPSSKRRRLKEPDGVCEAGWPLLVVPRLSEVEKVWEWSPRPFTAFLIPKSPGSSGGGRQRCDPGCGDTTFQTQNCWQSGISGRAVCSRAPGRSCEAGLKDGEGVYLGDQAEVSHAPPNTLMPHVQGVKQESEELPEKETILKEKNSVARQPRNPFLDVTFSEETKSALHEIKDRCKVDSVITSEKRENVSSSTLKIPKIQNQACLESAKPSYFRDSITKNFPEFPRDLNSNMSFVYLKEVAKKKNDKIVAYVRDFTNIFLSQNRPDAKKQKLQDKKYVHVENDFSDYSESNHQSLTIEGKIDLINLNYYRHGSIECDVRDSKKNITLTLENANLEGAERNQDYYIPTRQKESQSPNYNKSILKRKQQNWRMKKFRIIYENMNKHGEHLNLALCGDLLHKADYHSVKVRNVMIGTLGSPPNLIKVVWFNGKGENINMLQLRYYTLQKYISGNKEDSTLICHEMSTCEKQIDTQKSGVLSKYLQNSISEFLNMILKTNTVSLLDNFDSFIRNAGDGESEEGCIFKYIVNLNYLKNIIQERHIVYLTKMLTSSRLLEHNTKSTVKKRKLFKMEHVLEWAKKQNINSLTMTTKKFPVYKVCENVPLLMNFDSTEELSLTKQPSYENTNCAEQLLNMGDLAYYMFGISNSHVKSDLLFIQNNCGHINEKYYESSMCSQDLDTERKWKHKAIHLIFKFIFEDVFNVRQLCMLLSQNTSHSDQINAMAITLKINLEDLLSKIEGKIYDFVLKKEMKVTKSSSSCQVHKAIDTKKQESSFLPMDRMSSVQSASLVSKSINMEETKSVNQNNGTSAKEDGGILQEIELTNSKHFHPENESALYANHQFESDSSGENNECFQGLTAKCLSTETLPIANEFEIKSKFDLVLEELRMFHEISKENEIPSTMETHNREENYFGESNDVKEARMEIGNKLEMVETSTRDTSLLPCDVKAGLNKHKRHQSLFNWKVIPTHGGQAVPNESCPGSEEELFHSTPEEDYKKPLPKSSTFSPDEYKKETLLKGGSHVSHGISRVQPLKTCSRPIRVGLSRRARLKQLHPYLK